nr:galactose mutarotase [Spirochaetaceae bacterium]
MKIHKEIWGSHKQHEVQLTTLENSQGISIRVMNWGATLVDVMVPSSSGSSDSVISGFDSLEEYKKYNYFFGASVGRYANRIKDSRFDIDGKSYQLVENDRGNQLHGGPEGFHRQLFQQEIQEETDRVAIHFTRTSPHGEMGYPGNLEVRFSYILTDENELIMEFAATTDKVSYVNLTNHAYWNLSGMGASLDEQTLRMCSPHYAETDNLDIPTGNLLKTAGSPLDFNQAIPLKEAFEKHPAGFDHSFELPPSKEPQIEVKSPKTGRRMTIWTNQHAVQLYTCNNFPNVKIRQGLEFGHRSAYCLEVQGFPDSMH